MRSACKLRDVGVELPRTLRAAGVRVVAEIERVGDGLRGQDFRAHVGGEGLRVEGGGHGGEVQVIAQKSHFHRHGQHQVGVQLAFVDLVDEHRANTGQLWVFDQPIQQDARGDKLHRGALFVLAADGIADELAKRSAIKLR